MFVYHQNEFGLIPSLSLFNHLLERNYMFLGIYPTCCQARILHNFKNETLDSLDEEEFITKEVYQEKIFQDIKNYGSKLIVAITTNQQKQANKALKAMGFARTTSMAKLEYPDNKLILWHKKPTMCHTYERHNFPCLKQNV